jgi:hypothetical protein
MENAHTCDWREEHGEESQEQIWSVTHVGIAIKNYYYDVGRREKYGNQVNVSKY